MQVLGAQRRLLTPVRIRSLQASDFLMPESLLWLLRHKLPGAGVFIILLFVLVNLGFAKEISPPATLIASWYSVSSLKKEGTYKYSKGIMANGKEFRDENFTCATRAFPLGTWLRVVNLTNSKEVRVKVTDRISKRFARTRIDLSKAAFQEICNLDKGLCKVRIEITK